MLQMRLPTPLAIGWVHRDHREGVTSAPGEEIALDDLMSLLAQDFAVQGADLYAPGTILR